MFHGNIDQFGKSLPGIQLCLRSDLRKQTRKRKDKKSIQRCQIDRLAKGYKRAIDKIRGPIAKNGFSGQNPPRWPENDPPSGRTATKNRSEGAKSKISSRVTNGPLTKSGVQ